MAGTVIAFSLCMRNEGVNVALCVGDLLQGETDHALAMTAGEVVGIEGPSAAPADHLAILVLRPLWRHFG